MRRVLCVIAGLLFLAAPRADAATRLLDEAVSQGFINEINCEGTGIVCVKSGIRGTLTVSSVGGGTFITQEADSNVDTATGTLDFQAGFDLTSSPAGEANVALDGSEIFTGGDLSWSGNTPTIAANAVALTTDTTGNYVASVATTSPLSGGAAGSEGATLTLTIADAAADGATKGAASFDATDFAASSGNISFGTDPTISASLAIGGNATAAGFVRFLEDSDNGSNYVQLQAPAALGANQTIVLSTMTDGRICKFTSAGTLLTCDLTCADITGSADLCDGSDATGAGGGDAITVNTTAATDANLKDSAKIAFSIDTGASPDDITALPVANSFDAGDLAADSVSASELNETGVEAGLEAVLDLADQQGTIGGSKLDSNTKIVAFGITLDGEGAAITTGVKGYLEIPYALTITGWTALCDQSGSIVVDVWKDTYANYPPTVADTIAGSEKPTVSSATKGQDLTLSSWTTSVSAGDTIGFNVDSATTVQRCHVVIRGNKT